MFEKFKYFKGILVLFLIIFLGFIFLPLNKSIKKAFALSCPSGTVKTGGTDQNPICSSYSNANILAIFLGNKPIVTSFAPTSGQNDQVTSLSKIIGHNFTGTTIVSLDDSSSTTLNGSWTISTGCDENGENCGGSGYYDKITGLSIPSGIIEGNYNLLVTTSQGTNSNSEINFSVTSPPASSAAQITSISPNPLITSPNSLSSINLNVQDNDSSSIYWEVTSSGGSYDNSNGNITLNNNEGGVVLNFTAGSSSGAYVNTFKIDDDGEVSIDNDDFIDLNIYVF